MTFNFDEVQFIIFYINHILSVIFKKSLPDWSQEDFSLRCLFSNFVVLLLILTLWSILSSLWEYKYLRLSTYLFRHIYIHTHIYTCNSGSQSVDFELSNRKLSFIYIYIIIMDIYIHIYILSWIYISSCFRNISLKDYIFCLNCLDTFIENQLTIYIRVPFWILSWSMDICIYLMSLQHCFDFCRFKVSFEIRCCKSYNFVLFKNCSSYSSSFAFSYKF